MNREISNQATNTKLAEERANIAQQRLFGAVERLDVGFILWDANMHFVHCNSFFSELQGASHKYLSPGLKYKDYLRQVSNSDYSI